MHSSAGCRDRVCTNCLTNTATPRLMVTPTGSLHDARHHDVHSRANDTFDLLSAVCGFARERRHHVWRRRCLDRRGHVRASGRAAATGWLCRGLAALRCWRRVVRVDNGCLRPDWPKHAIVQHTRTSAVHSGCVCDVHPVADRHRYADFYVDRAHRCGNLWIGWIGLQCSQRTNGR
jgi:hypothetical protein